MVNAHAEISDPSHPAYAVIIGQKRWMLDLFTGGCAGTPRCAIRRHSRAPSCCSTKAPWSRTDCTCFPRRYDSRPIRRRHSSPPRRTQPARTDDKAEAPNPDGIRRLRCPTVVGTSASRARRSTRRRGLQRPRAQQSRRPRASTAGRTPSRPRRMRRQRRAGSASSYRG